MKADSKLHRSETVGDATADLMSWPDSRTTRYTVVVLAIGYMLAIIDRSVLGLLVEPIRLDLGISDTQVSLLGGAAFAIFYVVMGLPMGWLADNVNRRNLIAIGVLIWTVATTACGLAHSFWQLFITRIGVGVGEATLSPAALSMISDSFPPERRQVPLGVYMCGAAVGAGVAYIVGGTVIHWLTGLPHFGLPLIGAVAPWQMVFLVIGLPGILLVPFVLRMTEPTRRELLADRAAMHLPARPRLELRKVLRFVFVQNGRTIALVFIAYAGLALHQVSLQMWLPAHFRRTFNWTEGQIGVTYGVILLIFATLGMVGGSKLATYLQRKGHKDALLRAPLWMTLIMTPFAIGAPLMPDPYLTLLFVTPVTTLSFGLFAVVPGILHAITPNEMRGQVTSLFAFVNNVAGIMLGATFVAFLTDYVFRDPAAINLSLAVTALVALLPSALLLAIGLKHFRRSVDHADAWRTR